MYLIIQAYWDWSWDELVQYDVPATFQYVHDQTGQKIHYVGHSLVTYLYISAIPFLKVDFPTYGDPEKK